MPIDLNSQEILLLLRQFERGKVVLFAGAGFSLGARNTHGEDPPLGRELAKILAKECGWSYDDEDLGTVYEEARNHLGAGLRDLLFSLYRDCEPAPWHRLVADLFWYRIYTTNIDDVLENAWNPGVQRLHSVTYPAAVEDHDVWFETVQAVHLHGSVLDVSKGFTFTPAEYGMQTAVPNSWYQALIDDMQGNSVLFVGTRLNEPPMFHYLALRSERARGVPETRAKAFLVAPSITQITRRKLEGQGFSVIEATGEEFFESISPVVRQKVPSRLELLKTRYPEQISAISQGVFQRTSNVLRYFDAVQPDALPPARRRSQRELFFEGAEITWDDIVRGVDADRGITSELLNALTAQSDGLHTLILLGHAGSGKSTVMRRAAYNLANSGHTVYYCKAPQPVDDRALLDLIDSLGDKRVYLFFDDAIVHLRCADDIAAARPNANVSLVMADRPHVMYPRLRALRNLRASVIDMPNLDRADCERIISKLFQFGVPGELKGKPHSEQVRDFLGRSRKQLLVAMKEATSGVGFDVILKNEFETLSNENARLAYLMTCLAYMHGAPVKRRHLVAALGGTDIDKATLFAHHLRDVVVPWKDSEDLLCPRHRIIAHQVATEIAPPGLRAFAIAALLSQLSADITPYNISRRTPEYAAYRGIINFDNMLDLFGDDYELIGGLYTELKAYYPNDFLFWLQFGRAEVHFDHFAVAENYLNQSLGIKRTDNFQAWHNLGVLYLKRGRYDQNEASADADLRRGEEILRAQILERGDTDAYPYAALATHKLRFLQAHRPSLFQKQVGDLVEIAEVGLSKHPLDTAMQEAHEEVMRAYLMLSVSGNEGGNLGPDGGNAS